MNKLNYIKQIVETYEIEDPNTRAELSVTVTEGIKGIYFEMHHTRVMSPDGIDKCIELLEQLVQRDCFNSVPRKSDKKKENNSGAAISALEWPISAFDGLNKKSP